LQVRRVSFRGSIRSMFVLPRLTHSVAVKRTVIFSVAGRSSTPVAVNITVTSWLNTRCWERMD
jgi:hypothetical protein